MNEIITVAIDAAREAGVFLLENFGRVSKIESKKDGSLATNLDKEAEQMIVRRVRARFPGHGVIGEEGAAHDGDEQYLWIIDPLDGTHNFIHGIDIFGVSIGVARAGKLVAGVIYMPPDNELYAGEEGSGAFKNGKRISVSSVGNLSECSISFDSAIRHAPAAMLHALGKLAPQVFNIRMLGSSARQLSYVAEGKLEFAVEFHDRSWDFAGGVPIIEQAGGKAVNLKGGPLTHRDVGYIVSNPHVFSAAKDLVISAIEEHAAHAASRLSPAASSER